MQLVPIFVPVGTTTEGLYAIRYNDDETDALEQIMNFWYCRKSLETFCEKNIGDLPGTKDEFQVEKFILSVMAEAEELECNLEEAVFSESPLEQLQSLFKPLNDLDGTIVELQPSKTSVRTRRRPHPMLRLYAIRLAQNLYIITGGAIKLTRTMKERNHTQREFDKITFVRDWLRNQNITEPEDLNDND